MGGGKRKECGESKLRVVEWRCKRNVHEEPTLYRFLGEWEGRLYEIEGRLEYGKGSETQLFEVRMEAREDDCAPLKGRLVCDLQKPEELTSEDNRQVALWRGYLEEFVREFSRTKKVPSTDHVS